MPSTYSSFFYAYKLWLEDASLFLFPFFLLLCCVTQDKAKRPLSARHVQSSVYRGTKTLRLRVPACLAGRYAMTAGCIFYMRWLHAR